MASRSSPEEPAVNVLDRWACLDEIGWSTLLSDGTTAATPELLYLVEQAQPSGDTATGAFAVTRQLSATGVREEDERFTRGLRQQFPFQPASWSLRRRPASTAAADVDADASAWARIEPRLAALPDAVSPLLLDVSDAPTDVRETAAPTLVTATALTSSRQLEADSGVLAAALLDPEYVRELDRRRAQQAMDAAAGDERAHLYVRGEADDSTAASGRVMESSRQRSITLGDVYRVREGDAELFGVKLSELERMSSDEEEEGRATASKAASGSPELFSIASTPTTSSPPDTALDGKLNQMLGIVERALHTGTTTSSPTGIHDAPAHASRYAIVETATVDDFDRLVPHPARTFPFELDRFQKQAIVHLERGEHVFVAAHTSAGKTVVAEYAIALTVAHATKTVYTSPIKTLSNQKFRDFAHAYGPERVGLITGDVSIQPSAPCLVMTTEILRSMLYRGADLIRDVEWVVFDEVHYVNDEERGVVWEEVIILLPPHVNIIMLSATVPNAREFAEWVGRCKQRCVYVISTPQRPVPLQHYLFAKNEMTLVKDAGGAFLQAGFRAAQALERQALAKRAGATAGALPPPRHSWGTLVNFLRKRDLMPAVVFCFSKRRCEDAADALGAINLLEGGAEDAHRVHAFMESALARLRHEDRHLPQLARVRDLLKRGIGVHHAGLLPIVKELTEILFQRGLVRVLFATETFAMGVNMPARTVVFTGLRKHDGRAFRYLTPGEYTQMSGRAGRRGLDAYGLVLLFLPPGELPSELEVRRVMTGVPLRLQSRFRLTFNTILNLLRTEYIQVEELIRRSFSEVGTFGATATMQRLLRRGRRVLQQLERELHAYDAAFGEYYAAAQTVLHLSRAMHTALLDAGPQGSGRAACPPGRLMLLRRRDGGLALGAVLQTPREKRYRVPGGGILEEETRLVVPTLVLLGGPALQWSASALVAPESSSTAAGICGESMRVLQRARANGIDYEIGDVAPAEVVDIFTLVLRSGVLDAAALLPVRGAPQPAAVAAALEALREVLEEYALAPEKRSGAKQLVSAHPRHDLGVANVELEAAWGRRQEVLYGQWLSSACLREPALRARLARAYDLADRQQRLSYKLAQLEYALSDQSLQLMPDYLQRIAVLQRLHYVEAEEDAANRAARDAPAEGVESAVPVSQRLTVTLKGRAACEVGSCDSLLMVELILEGVLTALSPAQVAALLSCLVFQEKLDSSEYRLPDEADENADAANAPEAPLARAYRQTQQIALALGVVLAECGLPVSPLEFLGMSVNPGLMMPCLAWADGASFRDICDTTPVQEGSVVRTVIRLSELLRETRNVARVIGDNTLYAKADEAVRAIKRDIIFAASLYVS
ncbi:hypothetical protein CDCA_CDCA18G4540 [Cyanidium caldarium]|uniref:Uncharacterized protein n=1 Tax=Cyanidium caldarium TaxID=2771 RepID=A0AAV9J2H3_CYACA|nr:hypothetical protein CDCA_CDCA18G4540 [Cyanidium caldarium]